MTRKKFLKQFVSDRFFDFPPNALTTWRYAKKMNFLTTTISSYVPTVYICNRCNEFDKFLVAYTIKSNYVFLKDEYIFKIIDGTISKDDLSLLLNEISVLESISASIVIFPEKQLSIFGSCETLNSNITDFIASLGMDVKFLNLIGSFFSYPVWATQMRDSQTRSSIQFAIKKGVLVDEPSEKINKLFNSYMPSSASIYSRRYNPDIISQRRAENLETILYACPHCKKLFSVYSEFSCVKCRSCGKAVELNPDGSMSLSKNIESLDDYKELQFKILNKTHFTVKPLVTYEDIKICKPNIKFDKFSVLSDITLEIYADKLHLFNDGYKKNIKIENITDIELKRNNVLVLKTKKEEIYLQGQNKENFYIIFDLRKIVK